MNIVFFNSHTLLASHYETELELMSEHLIKRDNIVQLTCDKELPACDTNPYHMQEACERCVSKRKHGLSLLSDNNIKRLSFFKLTDDDKRIISKIPKKFSSINELQQLKYGNFDLGYAVASSIISLLRDPNPSLDDQLTERFIVSSLGVYFSIINYIKENPTDIMYVFNGRVSVSKAALSACQFMGITCVLHERGNSIKHYSLFKNSSILDLNNTQNLIVSKWNSSDPNEREQKASAWFNTRIGGKMENWYSFLADQIFQLPENWDETKENILICNSSEDEMASLGDEWKNPLYLSQSEGILRIIEDSILNTNIHFYLRIHPNLVSVSNSDIVFLKKLERPNLTVIQPDSKLSTYHLINACSKTITFGSTAGIEATFMGKPSILAGKSLYCNLGGNYIPSSHEELLKLLNSSLTPMPKDAALMFGFFFSTFGIPFKHYDAEDFGKGKFKGSYISPNLGFKYKFIKLLFHNTLLPILSEKISLKSREDVMKKYLL
jgi:hypothetical protein